MMTNASPGDSLQLIGFPSHQNQGFIDHDKAARPGRRRISGQKEVGRIFSSYASFQLQVSHPVGEGRLWRDVMLTKGEGQLLTLFQP